MVVIEGKIVEKTRTIPIIGKSFRYVIMKKNSNQKITIKANESDINLAEGKEIKLTIE